MQDSNQGNYKQKLTNFYAQKKRMPTYAEMMHIFGFQSKNAVSKVVDKLIDIGLVAKDHLGRLVPTKLFGDLPLLGTVKAGFPAYAEEVTDTININDFLIKENGQTYMLEVDGESMIDAHIAPGDMILVERTNTAKDGQIVIAEVDGEFTLKYFKKTGEGSNAKIWLEPANKNFKAIYPQNSLNICAVLRAVIRKY
ncbi:repressor LexA [Candidatus Nomurabacteria bacterium RIFCSPHIGHO2_02_FULL_38_15]|uniref:Repressor LexA n=1 Tax=Candidatus Nomurabacteria bacterium RIFCSPHIGHO2_02_FULL_38_15 TaxID=1801752 RepID=A0A1F6VQ50_9BACT|nr:MAG: repressor LexA [Candidatus Nomurabacteria bacterium RIFCSPHIGHO2_02_FULL_38_15]